MAVAIVCCRSSLRAHHGVNRSRDTGRGTLDRRAAIRQHERRKSNEYFSDGISEGANLLAKIPQLRVTARTSSFSFRARKSRFPRSRAHCVAHVLEVGAQGRQLVADYGAADPRRHHFTHLWSQTYDQSSGASSRSGRDRDRRDQALKVTLLGAARSRVVDLKAYALFLQARRCRLHALTATKSARCTGDWRLIPTCPGLGRPAYNYRRRSKQPHAPRGHRLAREASTRRWRSIELRAIDRGAQALPWIRWRHGRRGTLPATLWRWSRQSGSSTPPRGWRKAWGASIKVCRWINGIAATP
jgi:hypothetical protein